MKRHGWIAWLVVLCFITTANLRDSQNCPKSCQMSLGLENGFITDKQLSAFSAYNNDSSTYGAHRARLNLKSWPPGFRALKVAHSNTLPWIRLDLGRQLAVTGIATQGYGDPSVAEWVSNYRLMYADKHDFAYFVDVDGEVLDFIGNKDSNTTRRHEIAVAAIASSLIMVPTNWHNNIGLRMEIYGCAPGYYFEAWLMLDKTPFSLEYMNKSSKEYKDADLKATEEIHSYFNHVGGYLFNKLLRLSPQQSPQIATFVTAEVAIYCLESSVHLLTTKLKTLIRESDTFEAEYLKIKYPLACDCRPPLVDVQLKHTVSESDIVYTTNRSFHLRTISSNNCSNSNQTQYQWIFSRIDSETKYFSPFLMYELTDRTTINLRPRLMGAGVLYVSVVASILNVPEAFAYDYGFLRIRQPDLVAKIVAPDRVSRRGSIVKLDGSRSYDPEFMWLHYRRLNFTWRCRRQCGEDPTDILTFKRADVEPCYGIANATNSVFSNQRAFTIDIDHVKSNCTYLFRLSVAKDVRIKCTEHALEVTPAVPFAIRCINNCKKKVSPQRLLTLRVFCGSFPCASLGTFSWTVHINSDSQGKPIWHEFKNSSGLFSTNMNTTQFNLPRLDALTPIQEGQEFQIKVQSTDNNGRQQEQKFYRFIANVPPKLVASEDTGCKVWPREGSAIITDFHISCLGWYDKDTPLRYAFKYTFSSSTIIIQDGTVGKVTSKLPLGDSDMGYERTLELQIIDAFGEFSTVFVKTKVKPPPASEALLRLIKEAQNEMKLLVQGNDVDKAADMAITVLSVVDKNDQLKQDETLKDSILNIMAGVEVNRLNLVTKVAVITAYSTKRVDHSLPQSAQEDATTLLRKSTAFLATMKNDTTKELQVGDEINVNILTGIGNVMISSSKQSDINKIDVDPNIDREKSKTITKDCMELVDVLKNEVITPEGICENPIVITTPFINLTACVEKANDMKVQKLLKGENGVKLPDPEALFPGVVLDDNTVIDVKLVSFKENPYTWHPKSRIVTSSVLDVTLKNVTSGKPLHVQGLKKPVELFIKNWEREKEQEKQQQQQKKKKEKPQEMYFVKPSPPKSTRNMRFHKLFLPYSDVDTSIKIIPSNNKKLEIYVRNKVRPSPAENNFETIVPNFSTCLNYTERDGFFNCLSDPYLFIISPRVTGYTGTHFLGIRYVVETLKNNITRSKRSCRDVRSRRKKRSCVEVKSPPVVGKLATSAFHNDTDVKYELQVTMGACMFWSVEDGEWTSRGCQIGSESEVSKIHCLCNHLSAFGGDFFVAPNPIDFDKVFAEFGRLGETGNFVVLSFVCVVFGLYAVGLVFARRADKKDDFEVAPNIHLMTGGDVDYTHSYDISIQTGIWRGCGTTANVTIVLFGDNGCTPPILLTQNQINKRFFARGSVNTFTLHLPESLGSLFKIQIWHDNSGKNPAWFFHQVLVTCHVTDEKWYFLGNRWLALEKGDGEIKVEICSAGKKESLAFRNLFYFRGAKTLGEKHLWLSLFTKAPHNSFTRCQRLSCCLSILFATMVTNAMFYQQGTESEDTFKVGPIQLSWKQIKIGLQSGLVAIPVNVIVVAIFRNIKQPTSKEGSNNDEPEDNDAKPIGCFPHLCVYIGWALCLMASLVSAAFVVFYSLMWGKKVANEWLTSVLISFFQDVIVIQPIKVVFLVSLLSLIVKKPIENDEVYGQGHSSQEMDKKFTSYPPRGRELRKVRSVSVLKSRLVSVLIDITVFLLFLFLLMMVCYGNRDSKRYQLTESVSHVFTRFEKVTTIDAFWNWTRKSLLPAFYDVTWYNGRPFSYKEGFIRNRESFMVGMPRLRQKRIKGDSICQVSQIQPQFIKQFPRCIPYYSKKNEDRTRYNKPKWIPIRNESGFRSLFERSYLCSRPWSYETAEELKTMWFQGLASTYSGGGYIADLGYNTEDALQVIDNLEINDWIDNMTAAVFIEFTLYEPASSLFSAVKLLFERFPNGGTNTITQFKTLTIYSPQDPNFRGFYETCQLLFMLLILFCVGTEVGKIYQHGCTYFKDPWSWLEIILLASSLISLAMFFLKESYTSEFIKEVKKNPFQSWSTDNIALWSDLEVALLSFVVFLVTMKLLRIIRFNPHIIQMRMTLSVAAKYFWSFSAVFITMIIAYVTLTTLTFGRNVYQYRSFLQSFSSVLLMLIGAKAPFHELQRVSTIIGPFFMFAYMVSIVMVFLNMFLAILNDAYTESRKQGHEGLPDLALSKLLKKTAKKTAKKTKVKTIKFLQELPQCARQKQSDTTVTEENETLINPFIGEKEDDSAFNDDDDISLQDIITLLSDIKHDISNSVMSLDDIVPMVTVYDADKRWSRPNYGSDDEGETFYSCSSLFGSESDSAIATSNDYIYRENNEGSLPYDALLLKEWNRRTFLGVDVFV